MKTIRCPQCKLVCWTSVSFCTRCNFDLGSYLNEQGILVTENVERSFSESSAQHFSANSNYNNNSTADYRKTSSANYNQNSHGNNSNYRFDDSSNNFRNSRNTNNQRQNYNYGANTSKGLAIWSLVLGILSLPFFSVFITSLIAVGLAIILGKSGAVLGIIIGLMIPISALSSGIVSLKRIKRNPFEFGGKGLAIAGICCAGFSLLTVPFVAAIAVPNILAARKSANEGSAIATLRKIAEAQKNFNVRAEAKYCAEIKDLYAAKAIDSDLQYGEKNGYRFSTKVTERGYCAVTATPLDKDNGTRAFYFSNEDGILRQEKFIGAPATGNSKPLE